MQISNIHEAKSQLSKLSEFTLAREEIIIAKLIYQIVELINKSAIAYLKFVKNLVRIKANRR